VVVVVAHGLIIRVALRVRLEVLESLSFATQILFRLQLQPQALPQLLLLVGIVFINGLHQGLLLFN
jgi:hypothetical protein